MNRKGESGSGYVLDNGPEEIRLTDILDHEQLQGIFDNLAQMLGVAVALIDLEGKVLIGSGWQKICAGFHRICPETCKNCIESDTVLTSGLEPGRSILYKCKNNLWDMATPVFVEGKKLGNIFVGQFFLEEEEPDADVFKDLAGKCGFDEGKYLQALEKVPRISREKAEWAMSFLVKWADYISELGLKNLQLARALEKNSDLFDRLATSEALLKIAGHLVSLGGWQFDIADNRLVWSEGAARIHDLPPGYSATVEEAKGFYAPISRPLIDRVCEECVKNGTPYDEEFRKVTSTGRNIWVREIGEAVRDETGKIIRVQGAFQDITEWKRTEESLRRSEEKYRRIAENMSDVVWTADLGMNTTYVSPSVQKLSGETPEEHLARKMEEKFPPEELAKLMSLLEEEMERERSGDAPRDRSRIVEVQHYRADGSLVWISMNISFIRDEKGDPVGFQGVSRDISERRKLETDYATLFHEMLDAFVLLEIICDTEGDPVDYRFITVNPAFERMTGLRLNDVKGRTVLEVLPDIESYWIEGFGHVALTGEPVFFENYAALFGKYFEIKAFSPVPGQFATIFTDVTGRKDFEEKLRGALERTIRVLTQTVERRDPYTAGHQRRVSGLAAAIAREMGMDPDMVEQIRISGYVHDLGKISVPAEILSKPGRLSELEMNIIREHPAHGRDILLDVESGWDLAEIVYQHHERLDGSGYPRGLKGEEISLEARVLAVADAVEAMAFYRPYRPAIGLKEALEEIETKSGILYDPEVVRVCLDLFREKGYQLEE